MNISPTAYNPRIALKANDTKQPNKMTGKSDYVMNYSPATIGLVNAGGWFGIGLVFDRICKHLFGMTTSLKTSLVVNGTLGVAMGAYAYFNAKRMKNGQ